MDYSEFTTIVSSFVPNVPTFVVSKAAQQCCSDFFGRANLFREKLTTDTVIGQQIYPLIPVTSDTFINQVLSVKDSNDKDVPFIHSGNELLLTEMPSEVKTLTLEVSLVPTVESTEIPDHLFYRYTNTLRDGTIAILKSQVGTEWYSPQEATFYMGKFEQDINQARILYFSERSDLTMRVPSFN